MNRPLYHFTPPQGWCNDPNGLVYDGAYYHLFYQYHPHSLNWGPMHWGHARSRDLLVWEHLPIALYPDEQGMIYSGSAVMDGGRMALLYTYDKHGAETQAIAFSTDKEHTVFEKYEGNPVILNPGYADFRDPKIFHRDEAGWHMVVGAGDRALFYVSRDLLHWAVTGECVAPESEDLPKRPVWECPDLFPLTAADGTTKWVLVVSYGFGAQFGGGRTLYFLGQFDGRAFTPDASVPLPMDQGMAFYAGVTFWGAPNGRRIMMAWMSNWAYSCAPEALGWRGQMTLPRELALINTAEGYCVASKPIAPPQAITRLQAGGLTMEVVTDTYSVEMFAPEAGVALTQTLFR